jgi:GNAT superfamily N-acetyltransferase
MKAIVRPASNADIEAMHHVRLSVHENRLSDAGSITEEAYARFVEAGSAWVAELAGEVAGFAALDASAMTVWALFVHPSAERCGIGTALHDRMISWACERKLPKLSLPTTPGTRAEAFYIAAGWQREGFSSRSDVCFSRQLRR